MWKFLLQIDHQLFFWLNPKGSLALDSFVAWYSYLGRPIIVLGVCIPLVLLVSRKYHLYRAGGFLILIFLADACTGFLKIFFDRARPFIRFEQELASNAMRLVDQFGIPDSPAFPSGHTLLAFAVVVYFHRLFGPSVRPFYAWAVLMGVSRIYLGVHFPADIVAGALLGTFIGWLVVEILHKFVPDIDHGVTRNPA